MRETQGHLQILGTYLEVQTQPVLVRVHIPYLLGILMFGYLKGMLFR